MIYNPFLIVFEKNYITVRIDRAALFADLTVTKMLDFMAGFSQNVSELENCIVHSAGIMK